MLVAASVVGPAQADSLRKVAIVDAKQAIASFTQIDDDDYLKLVSPTNGKGSRLARATCGQGPVWSPTRSKILYAAGCDFARRHVYVLRLRAADKKRLTSGDFVDDEPGWSPDSKWVVFGRVPTEGAGSYDNWEIFKVRADGTDLTQLTSDGGSYDPVWSPDGNSIVYAKGYGTGASLPLWRVDPTGEGAAQFTHPPPGAFDSGPLWSPDGTQVLFNRHVYGSQDTQLYIVSADGLVESRVTNLPGYKFEYSWSPDGTEIVFDNGIGRDDTSYEQHLWRVDANGTDLEKLTPGLTTGDAIYQLNPVYPSWSANGQRIAYLHFPDDYHSDIWIMRRDGSNKTRLTKTPEKLEGPLMWATHIEQS